MINVAYHLLLYNINAFGYKSLIKHANKRPLLSCLFCDRASSSDLFLISFLITSLCDGVAWRCSREARKGWVLVKRCGASGPMVETHRLLTVLWHCRRPLILNYSHTSVFTYTSRVPFFPPTFLVYVFSCLDFELSILLWIWRHF